MKIECSPDIFLTPEHIQVASERCHQNATQVSFDLLSHIYSVSYRQ